MKHLSLVVLLVMAVLVSMSPTNTYCAVVDSGYQFYHVAVRDFNGDGNFNYDWDQVRYGFTFDDLNTNTEGWYAKAYDSNGKFLQGKMVSGSDYMESNGSYSWREAKYWRASFDVNGIETVKLYNDIGVEQASHNVTLPDIGNPIAEYNGHDPLTVSWARSGAGVLISWDSITSPNSNSSYRLSVEHWGGGNNYSILTEIEDDQTSIWLSDTLLDVVDLWNLQFQERFKNPNDSDDNFDWLRSYSAILEDCDFSAPFGNPVPIPGSSLLFGFGLFGLFALKRR